MVKGLKGHPVDTGPCVSRIRNQGKELAINMGKDLYTNPLIFEEFKQSNGLAYTKVIALNKGKSFGLTETQPIFSFQAFKPNHTNPDLKCQPNPSSCKPTHPSKHKPLYIINPSKSEIGPKSVVPNSKPKSPTKTFNPHFSTLGFPTPPNFESNLLTHNSNYNTLQRPHPAIHLHQVPLQLSSITSGCNRCIFLQCGHI